MARDFIALDLFDAVWLCSDWRCPSRDYCGKHFWLSKEYAAMNMDHPRLIEPHRNGDQCQHYTVATRDYFAESLGEVRVFSRATGAC